MKSRTVFPQPPKDSIQQLATSPDSKLLAASSWDQNVYIYDTVLVKPLQTIILQSVPLSIVFVTDDQIAIGCSDGQILLYTLSEKATKSIGKHSAPVRTLNFFQKVLFSSSYDETVTSWDVKYCKQINTFQLPGRPFSASNSQNSLTIATSNREILAFDADLNLTAKIESPLRHQTRSLAQGENALAIASVEGRIALEGNEKFAFRAHKIEGVSYPVNGLVMVQNKLISSGSDGQIYVWDLKLRKKIFKVSESGPVACLAIGSGKLYVGKSYVWENLAEGQAREEIGIIAYELSEIVG